MAIQAASSITSDSGTLKMDYMKLLVAQLQNQNPLEPMDNNQMTAQLTSMSQLEQLETMNTSFGKMLRSSQYGYAQSLIGKDITYYDHQLEKTVSGEVDKVIFDEDGTKLVVGDKLINIDEVMAITDSSKDQSS